MVQIPGMNDSTLTWLAPAYHYREKTAIWYLLMGVLVLSFVFWGVYTESYVVSVTFLLFAGVYYLLQREKPKLLKVKITEDGILFGETRYQYGEITSFWIYDEQDYRSLNFLISRKWVAHISIDIPAELPTQQLRVFLAGRIKEQADRKETFTESVIRELGL